MSEAENVAEERRRFYFALVPFVIAVPTLVMAAVLWCVPHSDVVAVLGGVVFAILVFDLATCIYVLIPWLRTGKPPELWLFASPDQRRFHRRLRGRPKLNDAEFYEAFFASTNVPEQLPIRLRMILEDLLWIDLGGLHPEDNLAYANDELDFADVIKRVEEDFKIVISRESWKTIDGTFNSLLLAVQNAMICKAASN